MKKLGFIGYGLRSDTMMKAFRDLEADVTVAAITDPREEEVRAQVKGDPLFANTAYYPDADAMLDNASLDGVFVGTRCGLHTPLACKVLQRGLPLFLEKPVAITRAQFEQLRDAARGKEHLVTVSFPLRLTTLCLEVRAIVESGAIGRVTQVQAVNNVPYGSVYYHSWYRDESLTGGLFLQKMTHDIDYITFLAGMEPVDVFARCAKLYYKGDKPAGLTCQQCPEYRTCIESEYVVKHVLKEESWGNACCFAEDTGNMDVGAALFTLQNGALVSYSQNFIAKKSAARRGCRLLGTEGAVEFDFYTGDIREDRYRTAQSVVHHFDNSGQHFGGDERLALDFLDVMDGKRGCSGLRAGLMSAAACLAAKESSETGKLVTVGFDEDRCAR